MPMNPGGVPNTTALPVVRSFTSTREPAGVDFVPRASALQVAAAVVAVWSAQARPSIAAVLDDFVPRTRLQASAPPLDVAKSPRVGATAVLDDFVLTRPRLQAQEVPYAPPFARAGVASFAPDPAVVPDYVPPPPRAWASTPQAPAWLTRDFTPQDDFVPDVRAQPPGAAASTPPFARVLIASFTPDPIAGAAYVPPPQRVWMFTPPASTFIERNNTPQDDFVADARQLPASAAASTVPLRASWVASIAPDPAPVDTYVPPPPRVWASSTSAQAPPARPAAPPDEFVPAPAERPSWFAPAATPLEPPWVASIAPNPVVPYVPPAQPMRVAGQPAGSQLLRVQLAAIVDDYQPTRTAQLVQAQSWLACTAYPHVGALFDPGPLTTGYVPYRRTQASWPPVPVTPARTGLVSVQEEFVPAPSRPVLASTSLPAALARTWTAIVDPGPVVYVPPPQRVATVVQLPWWPSTSTRAPIVDEDPPPPPPPTPTPTPPPFSSAPTFSGRGSSGRQSLAVRLMLGQMRFAEPPPAASSTNAVAAAEATEIEADLLDEELDAATKPKG